MIAGVACEKMHFYKSISTYYDDIFPADRQEINFLVERLAVARSILDIGCGTGIKTAYFESPNREVIGIDQDEEMIAAARAKHYGCTLSYEVLDMLDIGKRFSGRAFDTILCLGNTLVHLTNLETMSAWLKEVYALLGQNKDTNGDFVLQILNYDRILDKNIEALPVLENEKVKFARFYRNEGKLLRFVTELHVKETDRIIENDIPLYPLRGSELISLLTNAGFKKVENFGNYLGDPLKEDSFVNIAVCCKASSG